MKKHFAAGLICMMIALAFNSCRKDSTPAATLNTDYFQFGYSGGFSGISHYYVLKDGQLYPGDTTQAPLSNDKYNVAKTLIHDFPGYLTANPDRQFGCQGCMDEEFIVIYCRINGVGHTWALDEQTSELPIQIRYYASEITNVMQQL